MNKILESFNRIMKVAKNIVCCWQAGVIIFGVIVTIYIPKLGATTRIFCGIISVLIIIFIWIEVSYWQLRKRWKRFSHSTQYVHRLTHNVRENIGKQCQLNWGKDWPPKRIEEHLIDTLKRILDDGAACLSKLTGEEITACMLMPVGKIKGIDGRINRLVFKTMLYGGNPTDDRIKGSKIHERDIIQHAYYEQRPIIHDDYEKECKQGIFLPARPDWRKYYTSSIMTSFSIFSMENQEVKKKVWGVLSFDCLKKKAFKEDWKYLVCAFSDALGLVLSLQDPYCEDQEVMKIYKQAANRSPSLVFEGEVPPCPIKYGKWSIDDIIIQMREGRIPKTDE